ncbi:MAG: divalent-cation tolerance protein CutA [Deltaproteobacteria bacterium]|nr:divalent-cation tolerance protein CutA [Deltaproteobacteria bacterium]
MVSGIVVALMTVPDVETGARIGRAAVEAGFAACANVVPGLRSIYSWKGKVCDDPEALVVFKTRAVLIKKLESLVRGLHPYEVFELVALPVVAGHAPYLRWVRENTIQRRA